MEREKLFKQGKNPKSVRVYIRAIENTTHFEERGEGRMVESFDSLDELAKSCIAIEMADSSTLSDLIDTMGSSQSRKSNRNELKLTRHSNRIPTSFFSSKLNPPSNFTSSSSAFFPLPFADNFPFPFFLSLSLSSSEKRSESSISDSESSLSNSSFGRAESVKGQKATSNAFEESSLATEEVAEGLKYLNKLSG